MKALEKDRRRRYETAGAFAADIARYRKHQPVEAGPPSAWYRGRKFARRHRLALTMTAIVALSHPSSSGCGPTRRCGSIGRRRAAAETRTELDRRAAEARRHRYVADIRQAHELVQSGQRARCNRAARQVAARARGRRTCGTSPGTTCGAFATTNAGHSAATRATVYHASFHPTAARLSPAARMAPCGSGTSPPAGRFDDHHAPGTEVNAAAFSPDGRTLATGGDDGRVQLWDVATGNRAGATIAAHKGPAGAGSRPMAAG